jgi:hypothetical protein
MDPKSATAENAEDAESGAGSLLIEEPAVFTGFQSEKSLQHLDVCHLR